MRELTPKWLLCILIISLASVSCKHKNPVKKEKTFARRDTSINRQNAYNGMFLDSMLVERYIKEKSPDSLTAQNLRGFYRSRNYQFAWFTKHSLNEQGISFWNLLNSFIHLSKDSSLFDKDLAAKMDEFIAIDTIDNIGMATLAKTDVALTQQFFIYADAAYAGRLDPTDLQWFIPRKKVDALALLDTLIARKGADAETWEPLNASYQALKKKLLQFNDIADKGGWSSIGLPKEKITYKPGDTATIIIAVRQRLFLSGDLPSMDSSTVYDTTLVPVIQKMQRSFGFKEDAIIDPSLVEALNVPVTQRIEQMLINLERMRWLPEQTAPDRIVVNIPEFMLHVFEQNKKVFDMPIVVGKEGSSTVIFNDQLKYIVFSPYWNVPRSIVRNEILPAMKRNRRYLSNHNMEQTGTAGSLPVIRQKPGGSNALGKVKFLFPNNYNIYFHDTPAKDLFDREKRAYSHGCIRLADAEKMAMYLLRDQPEWTPEKIREAMHLVKEKWVPLKKEIPVYITYFTAWVDETGILHFRQDIYGHDKKMAAHLFIQPDTTAVVQ